MKNNQWKSTDTDNRVKKTEKFQNFVFAFPLKNKYTATAVYLCMVKYWSAVVLYKPTMYSDLSVFQQNA